MRIFLVIICTYVMTLCKHHTYFLVSPEIMDELKQDSEFAELARVIIPTFITETESVVDGTSLAVSILVTFLITAAVVAFLGVILGLVLLKYSKRKKEKKAKANGHWKSHSTEEKTNL